MDGVKTGLMRITQSTLYNQGRIREEGMQCTVHEQKLCGAEECYWKSTVISKNRFLLNGVLCKVQVADSYK